MAGDDDAMVIDEDLYSRVQYVLGKEAMKKMSRTRVLVVGLGGLGCEVAKNLILTGVGRVDLHDDAQVTLWDLGSLFFAKEADVGKSRAPVVAPQLQELNPGCHVARKEGTLSYVGYDVVVFCDVPFSLKEVVAANLQVRAAGGKLVWAEARGVLGMVFTDGGDKHTVMDTTGQDPPRFVVTDVHGGVITLDDEEPCVFSPGDVVSVSHIEANNGKVLPDVLCKVKHVTIHEVVVDTPITSAYLRGGYVSGVSQPFEMSFDTFDRAAECSEKVSGDLMGNEHGLHKAFLARFRARDECGGRAEKDWAPQYLASAGAGAGGLDADTRDAFRCLCKLHAASFNPLACFVGGVAAQEVLKCCTQKYVPFNQFYYYDGRHCVADSVAAGDPEDPDTEGRRYGLVAGAQLQAKDRYASVAAVAGDDLAKRVRDLMYFVVGCGALGCELLKNFALLGLGCGPKGFVTVTDPDKIERSNLSRQFLFRNQHVGGFKSKVAAVAAKAINPKIKVRVKTDRVGPDTEAVFDGRFWDRQDGVVTALDNVNARLYTDAMCVRHMKKMFDSGTLGPQAHSQVILPKLSENYGATQDPVEKSIPQCTVHFFPYTAEHTIAYARDYFSGAFEAPAAALQSYMTDKAGYHRKLCGLPASGARAEVAMVLSALASAAEATTPDKLAAALRWARCAFEEIFVHAMQRVLDLHPLDKRDNASGELFWKGKMKPPKPLAFDAADELHAKFVVSAARLRAEMLGVEISGEVSALLNDAEFVQKSVRSAKLPYYVPATPQAEPQDAMAIDTEKPHKAAVSSSSSSVAAEESGFDGAWQALTDACAQLEANGRLSCLSAVRPLEFDKDGDNGHIAFLSATANLRSSCYTIPVVTDNEVKRISGRIIPAMITTTALITGLVCMELFKAHHVPALPLSRFRNAWVNLAMPLVLTSEVEPPRQHPYLSPDRTTEATVAQLPAELVAHHPLANKTWTVWEHLDVSSHGDATLQQLFDAVAAKYGISISQLSTSQGTMIYSEFNPLHQTALFQEVGFSSPVSSLVAKLCNEAPKKVIDFIVKGKLGDVFLGKLPTLRYKIV